MKKSLFVITVFCVYSLLFLISCSSFERNAATTKADLVTVTENALSLEYMSTTALATDNSFSTDLEEVASSIVSETIEPFPTNTEEYGIPSMRKRIFAEYPAISNFEWTYDYFYEEVKLEYQKMKEYWEKNDQFVPPTIDEWMSQGLEVHRYLFIDPLSETTISTEQIARLQEGLHIVEYLGILGKYPDYRIGAGFGEDQTYYYITSFDSVLKLKCRYYHTQNKDEAGPYDGDLGGGYWPLRLLSYEIISFSSLEEDAERAMQEYPEYNEHYDPRKHKEDASLLINDHWPELFFTKYGIA